MISQWIRRWVHDRLACWVRDRTRPSSVVANPVLEDAEKRKSDVAARLSVLEQERQARIRAVQSQQDVMARRSRSENRQEPS